MPPTHPYRVEARRRATTLTESQSLAVKNKITSRLGEGSGSSESASMRKEYAARMRRLAQLERETGLLRSWVDKGETAS